VIRLSMISLWLVAPPILLVLTMFEEARTLVGSFSAGSD